MYAALRAVIRFVPALTSVEIFCEDCSDAVALWSFDGSINWGYRGYTPLTATPGV